MGDCVLCEGRECGDVVCVKRGLGTLIEVSRLKKDGVTNKLQGKDSIVVHKSCRKKYTAHVKESSREPSFVGGDKGDAVVHRLSGVLDLRAANCRYHLDCYRKFQPAEKTPGRPSNETGRAAFYKLCDRLENDLDCHSVNELTKTLNEIAGEECYTSKHLKNLLRSRYGDNVVFTDFSGKNSVFCFRSKANQFVYDEWHAGRKCSGEDDRTRILIAAAKIIRGDIGLKAFDMDNYLVGGSMDEEYLVPDSLRLLISEIIKPKIESKQAQRTRAAISQSIVAACKPRSYISPIQLNLSMYMFLNEGSRNLIDLLHSLGFAASYTESRRFIGSLLNSEAPQEDLVPKFKQWAFDNADYNVRTLDGHGTFHNMGGICCATPRPKETLSHTVPRIKGKIRMDVRKGRIPVLPYVKPPISSLKNILAADLGAKRTFPSMRAALEMDSLWMSSFSLPKELIQDIPLPSWSGYMEVANANRGPYDVTAVEFLPFINLDPTNLSCIYTALSFAYDQCQKQGQRTCFVTFDQPLFMKATEISIGCPDLKHVVVMLGGFHLIMSYLGCIGEIMSGSGLEELFATVYAKASVAQMMGGHAYARAMRGHSLAQQALATLCLEDLIIDDDAILTELLALHQLLMSNETSWEEALPLAIKLREMYEERCSQLSSTNRTSKLWIEYMKQFEVVRLFTRALRSGNWELYLDSMKAMLPYFHAAAHLPYAKAVHIHLQKMESLEIEMDIFEFEKFTRRGYFTVRHQDLFFKGVAMDLTIEQKLMRHLKTNGLTRGRGITDSTLAQFVAAFPRCVPICEALEDFCGIRSSSSEQHVELRESWQVRDREDRDHFMEWLQSHSPFEDRPKDMLVSLSSGVVADSSINCDKAWEIGFQSMSAMHGQNFADLKLKRKDKIKPLAAMVNNIKIADTEVTINPNQLLNRIICMLNLRNGNLADYLEYELAPAAPSLFDDGSLRKTEKAALAKAIAAICPPLTSVPGDPGCTPYVVDGGMLMRAVVWPRPASYNEACYAYKDHILKRYGPNAVIVFDGYEDQLSTKAAEQLRRYSGKTSPNLTIHLDTEVSTAQANFMGNGANKSSLIRLLTPELESAGLTVVQATSDADTLIVDKALEIASTQQSVAVAANDTDILAVLIQRAPSQPEIFLKSPGSSGRPDKVYHIQDCQTSLESLHEVMVNIHALSGSDTTSALYGKGKVMLLKLLKNNTELIKLAKVFIDPESTKAQIIESGEKLLAALYGNQNKTLNELRYTMFNKLVARQKLSADFQLHNLPPTSAAAKQHSLRVFLQVQEWLGNKLEPTAYGWQLVRNRLQPVSSELEAAPRDLLDLIRCGCKKGCAKGCLCKRSGLFCTVLCSPCEGRGCSNTEQVILEDPDEDVDDPFR